MYNFCSYGSKGNYLKPTIIYLTKSANHPLFAKIVLASKRPLPIFSLSTHQ